uniref:Nucleotidyl transferase n=1 Tax=uncultured marine thaumarchaeote KM3_87_H02 TaxID=1456331 RepID=A0A075HVZ8_9ARCH|nr:nucleotidyl transferase [uncultured marine thaumarchaeote KM3_87_H02]
MKALILAGGRGKRLRPLTDKIPKSLIPINKKPLIQYTINYLKKFGINEIIICTGYKSNQIQNFLKKKKNFGCKIEYSIEKSPLGTAGAIRNAIKNLSGESFLVINGDVITNIDLKKILKKPNTIAANELKTKFGTMKIKNNKILKFNEKTDVENVWMNPGLYHLSTNILKILPYKGSLEAEIFPKLAKKKSLHTVKFKNVLWHSIDSFKDIELSSQEINSKKYQKFFK